MNSVVTLGSSPNEFKVTVKRALFWFYLIWIWPQMTKSGRKFSRIEIFFVEELISWSFFSFRNQLTFWALEFQKNISKYLFWMNCLKDNYGFLEFTISDLSNADTVCVLGQLVPGHVFSCKYSKRAEISSPPIWWYHELSWLQL